MRSTIRAALLAAGVLGVLAGTAQADERTIHYIRADVQTQEGAQAVYSHLRLAAYRVCEPANLTMRRSNHQLNACMTSAVDNAVQAIGSEKLTAINEAKRERDDLPAGG